MSVLKGRTSIKCLITIQLDGYFSSISIIVIIMDIENDHEINRYLYMQE